MMKIEKHFVILCILFFLSVFVGSYVYHQVEGWSRLDSVYFMVVTMTTIGYGDIVPVTVAGKLFTIFFSFFGIALAFYFVSVIVQFISQKQVSHKASELRQDIRSGELKKEKKQ